MFQEAEKQWEEEEERKLIEQGKEPPEKKQPMYTKILGLPIVRQEVRYGQLLRDIRLGKVRSIGFFQNIPDSELADREDFNWEDRGMDGSCLVFYWDKTMKKSNIPLDEYRILYAMEQNNIRAVTLPQRSVFPPQAPPDISDSKLTRLGIPAVMLATIYACVQYMVNAKGDAGDREKLRKKALEERLQKEEEARIERLKFEAAGMASMGRSAEFIMEELARRGIEYDEQIVRAEVARAQTRAEEEAEQDDLYIKYNNSVQQQAISKAAGSKISKEDMERDENKATLGVDEAEDFLRMGSVKVKKAMSKDEAENKNALIKEKMKQAAKSMKNVKLQYTDEDIITFDDVAGIGEAKVELMEVVDFFTKPERFKESHAKIPRGVLMVGPPGTGKTLLARAVAGEAGVAFLSLTASEFVEMFVGVGAARVRDLFAQARALAPAIVFIDELDAVGRKRGGAMGNDERDQTLNQLLSELDGFDDDSGVIIMAATNRRDVLDPALIRPGRFDRSVYVGLPDFEGRVEILEVHCSKKPMADGIDLKQIARIANRYSGAQLANLVNQAALLAAKERRETIEQQDLLMAVEIETLGIPKPLFSGEQRDRIAVQEASTALLATLMPAIEPVIKVSIQPREKWPLGQTELKINEDREKTKQFTRRYLEEQLLVVLAGRAGEEMLFGMDELSAMNEKRLITARAIAAKLCLFGSMRDDPVLGARALTRPDFQGWRVEQTIPDTVTDSAVLKTDMQMYILLNESYEKTLALLRRNRTALVKLVEVLKEKVSVSGDEVRDIVEELGNSNDLTKRKQVKSMLL